MEIARWILGCSALAVYVAMMSALFALAIRRMKTGQYASGLSFLPSFLAIVGILVLPVSSVAVRALWSILPAAIESLYFWFNLCYDIFIERHSE